MPYVLTELASLLERLTAAGYQLVGPSFRDGAIVLDRIDGVGDLPAGWVDEQDAGRYRLHVRGDERLFGYTTGPQAWKKFLYPPRATIWEAHRREDGFSVGDLSEDARFAFIGVRACDVAAIRVQDAVLHGRDPDYRRRRDGAFIVAVNCTEPGGTCFCASMATGPRVGPGFDIVLTELDGRFIAEGGSDAGAALLEELEPAEADEADVQLADRLIEEAAERMGRHLDTGGIKELLYANLDSPRWETVAARCLGCGNCTNACPTCFCSTIQDHQDLDGARAARVRLWDSCFTLDFSYIHGGPVRSSTASRYRQWLTHKLATWWDQFGSSGCVGCGRCITWCPVGIDITEEVAAIRAGDLRAAHATGFGPEGTEDVP